MTLSEQYCKNSFYIIVLNHIYFSISKYLCWNNINKTRMQIDYLIVGQGVAGTVLAQTLLKKGCKIMVLSDENPNRASLVAAGLYNPVTGKRMAKTWKAAELFPFMENFYKEFEQNYSCKIIYPKPVYKPFGTIEEQNTWLSAHEGEAFIKTDIAIDKYAEFINAEFGGFETNSSGHIDLPVFIKKFREKAQLQGYFIQEKFDSKKLKTNDLGIEYGKLLAKKILFCEGLNASKNPLFSWLPFVPSKGEILKVKINNFTDEAVLNKQVFIIPLGENTYRVGSTYQWDFESENPTEEGKKDLSDRLSQMIKMPFEVLDHQAGVRPSVRDRRPIIGFHPDNKNIGIFNGLGTKGVSMAPYIAEQFTETLLNDKQLPSDVTIERFYSLYSRSEI